MSTKISDSQLQTMRSLFALFEAMRHHMGGLMQSTSMALTPVHMRALDLCHRTPQCNQQQLAQQMHRDKGQMARIVQELERLGLVQRLPDAQDARKYVIEVTPSGEQACAMFRELGVQMASQLFADEDPQAVQAMHAMVQRLQGRLQGGVQDAA